MGPYLLPGSRSLGSQGVARKTSVRRQGLGSYFIRQPVMVARRTAPVPGLSWVLPGYPEAGLGRSTCAIEFEGL